MAKKYDYYKVPKGTPLTPSKKTPGTYRGLVHGKKGVKRQAELTKVSKPRSFFGSLLAFTAKALLAVVMLGALISVGAVLITSLVEGATAGLAAVGSAVSGASQYLAVGVSAAVLITFVTVGIKVARFILNRRVEDGLTREQGVPQAPAVARYARIPQQVDGQPPSYPIPADWYPDPSNPLQWRYWDGLTWTRYVAPRNGQFVPATHAPVSPNQLAPGQAPSVIMSSAQWQHAFGLWIAAGAVEQETWRLLTSARIENADQSILEAQRHMAELTAEQGGQQLRRMIEANPRLRDESLANLLADLVSIDRNAAIQFELGRARSQQGPSERSE